MFKDGELGFLTLRLVALGTSRVPPGVTLRLVALGTSRVPPGAYLSENVFRAGKMFFKWFVAQLSFAATRSSCARPSLHRQRHRATLVL